MSFRGIVVSADKQKPSLPYRNLNARANNFIWQSCYPILNGQDLTLTDQRITGLFHEACSLLEISRLESMMNRVTQEAMLRVPFTRAPMEFVNLGRQPKLQIMP